MSIDSSLVLAAIGAVLRYAGSVNGPRGFDYQTAGGILMIVGGIGLLLAVLWIAMRRRTEVIHRNTVDRPY